MTPNDFDQFSGMFNGVCELYGKKSSSDLEALYWQLLKGYSLQDVTRAFHQHAMNPDSGQFMPKPADVVRYIDGGTHTRAAKAWAKVDKARRSVGAYESVVFDDPVIHSVLADLGPWPTLCRTPTDELQFLRNNFEKRYQGYSVNPPANHVPYLIGQAEQENRNTGNKIAPPVPVGEIERCKQVLKGGSDDARKLTYSAVEAAAKKLLGAA